MNLKAFVAAIMVIPSILPLVEPVISLGGGLAFGLGDHPYPEVGPAPSNAEVVAAVVARLRELGHRPAPPAALRADLAGA